jgi:hypothetical protein
MSAGLLFRHAGETKAFRDAFKTGVRRDPREIATGVEGIAVDCREIIENRAPFETAFDETLFAGSHDRSVGERAVLA